MIRDESIEHLLSRVASGEPTPGGGATGAVVLAAGAALLSMAARFGGREDLAVRGDGLRTACLPVADADERGFAAVARAYAMPKDDEDDEARRSAAVQEALEAAVVPPRDLVPLAGRLLDLADAVLADANENVLSDVGTALGCVRAGLTAAVVTLLTDLGPLRDEALTAALRGRIAEADALLTQADAAVEAVRGRIAG